MADTTLIKKLYKIAPFSACSEKGKKILFENDSISEKNFNNGETIFSAEHGVCALISGKALVTAIEGGRQVILNTLEKGQCTGVASLFSSENFPTTVIAKTKCTAVFVPEGAIRLLIESDTDFAFGYTVFLTEKIRFLNKKIRAFTAPDTQGKLAVYILQNADDGGNLTVPNMSSLAKKLDIGRASLYRAFDCLISSGAVTKQDTEIHISDLCKLKQLSKKERQS